MALIEKKEYQSEVLPASQHHQVQVRVSNLIVDSETDEVKARTFSRYVLAPDSSLDGQPQEVKRVCQAVWVKSVKDKWTAFQAEQAAAGPGP